ncbi:unnamed protein product [Pieris brassicae]|uniref:C2H2-type domain-containing protein n=1 Tax=Pieris brassicae TaxID=7116 RepID=A0A9P0TXS2_PIEBR|nr:unnamed protein product [Pieris brassicae]
MVLANLLATLLNGHEYCALCFKIIIHETKSELHEEVTICENNTESSLKLLDILTFVLGDEISHKLSPNKTICKTCIRIAVNSYKFINTTKQNFTSLNKILDSLLNNIKLESYYNDQKTLFLVVDTKHYSLEKYYHKKIAPSSKLALKRIDSLIQDLHFKTDIVKNEIVENKKKQYTVKIQTQDMLYDRNDRLNLKCKECLKIYPTISNLRNHFIRVHAPKDYQCTICKRCFGSMALLQSHKDESHVTLVCSECGKTFNNRHTLKMHEISHYFKIVCKDCGRVYKSQSTYKKHYELNICKQISRASPSDAKFTCDYCNKRYTQKVTLRVHIQHEHLNYKSHECKWCKKKFWAPSRLKAHIIKHTQDKKFPCNVCGRKFVTKESLLYHTRSHTGEKPYKCDYCEQKFVSASRKAGHLKRFHADAIFQCTVCKHKYTTKICLENHMKTHKENESCELADNIIETKLKLPVVENLYFMSDEEPF